MANWDKELNRDKFLKYLLTSGILIEVNYKRKETDKKHDRKCVNLKKKSNIIFNPYFRNHYNFDILLISQ